MTDTTPPAQPEPTPPAAGSMPPAASESAPAPATDYTAPPTAPPAAPPAAAPYQAGATASPKQSLSLTSFITGIAGLIFSAIPGLGFLAAVAGVILGFIGKKKEPAAPRWMWMVGIIAGFVGILLSVVFIALLIVPFLIFGAAVSDPSLYMN